MLINWTLIKTKIHSPKDHQESRKTHHRLEKVFAISVSHRELLGKQRYEQVLPERPSADPYACEKVSSVMFIKELGIKTTGR